MDRRDRFWQGVVRYLNETQLVESSRPYSLLDIIVRKKWERLERAQCNARNCSRSHLQSVGTSDLHLMWARARRTELNHRRVFRYLLDNQYKRSAHSVQTLPSIPGSNS